MGRSPVLQTNLGKKEGALHAARAPSKYHSALSGEPAPYFLERLRRRSIVAADQPSVQTEAPSPRGLLPHHNIIAGRVRSGNRIRSPCHALSAHVSIAFRHLPSTADAAGRRWTENINPFLHAFPAPFSGLETNFRSLTGTQQVFGTLSLSHVTQTAAVSRILPRSSVTMHC